MRRSWIFDQMVSRGVFVPVRDECHWMNEQAASVFLAMQRRRARTVAVIPVVEFVIALLVSLRW